ncbi:TIGR02221 family CRISPR-associated protein [Mangrovibacterium sp.]|uniref:TIGR02221 family CRISPR-associated protein n=1 Tax=Mangrovibacterium sp. TaxID=1961364 RepID=UPI00356646A0
MRKILLSFLGTGSYVETGKTRQYKTANYKIDNKQYDTSFVSAALAEHLNIDQRVVIGTVKSMWEEYYRYFAEQENNLDEDFYLNLSEFVTNAQYTVPDFPMAKQLETRLGKTNIVLLKYGLNQLELRYNLEKILMIDDLLMDNDELYVDVTHGFRSFPLFAQQIIMYLKQVSSKRIHIKKIYYGMLDASRDLEYTPIVDLSIIQEMNDWINGAGLLIQKSDGSQLVPLIQQEDPDLAKLVDNFSKALNINYSHEIKKQYQKILAYDFTRLNPMEQLIAKKAFSEFKKHFKHIGSKHSLFQLDLAFWYFNKRLYGVAYLTLTEAIITYAAEYESQANSLDKELRENAKRNIFKINKDLGNLYKTVNKIRRNVAHMLDQRHDSYLNDVTNLEKQLQKAKRLMNY